MKRMHFVLCQKMNADGFGLHVLLNAASGQSAALPSCELLCPHGAGCPPLDHTDLSDFWFALFSKKKFEKVLNSCFSTRP